MTKKTGGSWLKPVYSVFKDITCWMHTASDSPLAAVDKCLGWESIFTTSLALKSNRRRH